MSNKMKTFTFRWQNYDDVFAEKRARDLEITKGQYIRMLVERDRQRYERAKEAK